MVVVWDAVLSHKQMLGLSISIAYRISPVVQVYEYHHSGTTKFINSTSSSKDYQYVRIELPGTEYYQHQFVVSDSSK